MWWPCRRNGPSQAPAQTWRRTRRGSSAEAGWIVLAPLRWRTLAACAPAAAAEHVPMHTAAGPKHARPLPRRAPAHGARQGPPSWRAPAPPAVARLKPCIVLIGSLPATVPLAWSTSGTVQREHGLTSRTSTPPPPPPPPASPSSPPAAALPPSWMAPKRSSAHAGPASVRTMLGLRGWRGVAWRCVVERGAAQHSARAWQRSVRRTHPRAQRTRSATSTRVGAPCTGHTHAPAACHHPLPPSAERTPEAVHGYRRVQAAVQVIQRLGGRNQHREAV